MSAIITKDTLQAMLNGSDKAFKIRLVGRALTVLMNNQTEAEKHENQTKELNGVGFTAPDAKSGTLTAKSFLRNKTLADWQLDLWVKPDHTGYSKICKYHSQLNVAARVKAKR